MEIANVIELAFGLVLIVASILAVVICLLRTPENLRGFYGLMYWILAAAAIIGGAVLLIFAFI